MTRLQKDRPSLFVILSAKNLMLNITGDENIYSDNTTN